MRVSALVIVLALLTACTVRQGGGRDLALADTCDVHTYAGLIDAIAQELGPESLPAMYRIIGPYDAVTRDFQPDRLNLYTDAAGVVQRITCG